MSSHMKQTLRPLTERFFPVKGRSAFCFPVNGSGRLVVLALWIFALNREIALVRPRQTL